MQPTADTAQKYDPVFWAPFQYLFSPTLLRPWAFVFKTEARERQLSWATSFQKALEDQVDEKKNKIKANQLMKA